jgi:hypothetical protein
LNSLASADGACSGCGAVHDRDANAARNILNRSCIALADGPFPGTAGPDLLTAPRRTGPWRSKPIDPGGQITGLACTSSRACVVVDAAGQLLVSAQPTAGPGTWHRSDTDPYGFNGVACQNVHSCVAVDDNGGVVIGRP